MTLTLLTIAPILAVILMIYLLDRYEREPLKFLLSHFILGAVVSIILTTLIYLIFDFIIPLEDHFDIAEQFFKAFFVVALTEEFSKYIIVRYYSQDKRYFNEPFDGIVYCVLVSMGFAATENFMYVLEGGYEVALLRAFTAIPAHATFGVLMGYFMGKAKFSGKRIQHNLTGLLLAMAFHGAYDFFLFIEYVPGLWIGSFISLVIGIGLSARAIHKHRRSNFFKIKRIN
ncbi:Membrane proteinase PrsW, cleaves anti-sigma factor RsiW, M82 family [Flavobacteriaceae bacterium MAR_2010_188]|nr:Membrane proteinase PrsW, cleaves anti-sigma factor RsiW, M82 family [Flavobacteriaceae bacterium MAR_2010_188]